MMKGVVFTEFLELVEDKFSLEIADRIITQSDLPSGGAYTSVGTYDYTEIVQLVVNLSKETQIPVPDLIKVFGQHLAQRFYAGFPMFFEQAPDVFDFLKNVDDYIHVEVKKLYPDAQLPMIACEVIDPKQLILTYSSARPFGDLAEGLIDGVIQIYKEPVNVQRENVSTEEGNNIVRFTLNKE
jgi:hypothetical protein